MKRNKIIVEESRINPKKMIVAKYRNTNKFKKKEEIGGLRLNDEKNDVVEESEKSPEYEEKINKLEVTYKQKIEKKEVKKLENRQEINEEIEKVKMDEEVKEDINELEEVEEIKEETEELEIEEELNEEIYEVQEDEA
ncbi:MAG: hypothetical protein IJH34_05480, partial [Romboutsia sp.]|nr:hypothetical protein [Romboutsia sp.]